MKKISIILLFTFVSIFMIAAFASADVNRYRNFQGTYEMSLKGNGLNSTCGFISVETKLGTFYKPDSETDCKVWGSTDTAYGKFVFYRDGSGFACGRNFAFDLPPGDPVARQNPFYIEFDYSISSEGVISLDITFPTVPVDLTTIHMIGKVSKNRETITLTNSNSPLYFDTHDSLFTATRILTKILYNTECEE